MSKSEALSLAAQLGFDAPKSVNKFCDAVEAAGLILGFDNRTGQAVILAADRQTVLARAG